jgi:hypothetical protein
MFKPKIRPPIFVVLPVAAALTAQTATVERPMRAGLGPAPRRSRAPAGTAASIASISTAEQAVQQQASAREAAFGPVFLGSALMTAKALAGGVFSLTHPSRRTHPRDRWRAAADRPDQCGHMLTGFAEPAGNRLAADARRDASVWRALTPTERTRDLQRPVWLASRLHHSRGRLEPVELMAS